MATDTAPKADPDAALLELARKRFRLSSDGENTLRKQQLEAKLFAAGEHWDPVIKTRREADGDPCLTFDLLKPQIKQITNQQRAMRPSIVINPVDDGSDPDTAEVLQGLIRHIETASDADDAYDQAGKDQTEIGRGWFRILTEYGDDETANQEIRIRRVRNPFSIYPDPACQQRDYSDAKFLFETSDWLPEDLRERYADAKLVSLADFEGIGDDAKHWVQGERIRVALYWVVNETTRLLALGGNKSRKVRDRKVMCYVMTGLEVLDRYEWAGRYIPYVPVIGEELDIEGKVEYRGVVHGAMSPSRAFDYTKSKTVEVIALTPLAPYVGEEGQFEGHETKWENANRKKYPYLEYKRVGLGGEVSPPPKRNFGEPPIQALHAEAAEAQNLIRMSTGFFNPLDRPKDESGVALRERRQQGEHGNSDYLDGLARGIRFAGRILVDLAPKIYDVARVVRITGRDNQKKLVMVHAGNPLTDDKGQPLTGDALKAALPEGVKGIYDLGVGKYDVTVTVGSTETARQEFIEQVGELCKEHPEVFNLIGDLYFEHMDMPGAKQIAERLKKMLPPQLQDQDGAQDPARVMAQAQQMAGQIQELQAKLQEAMRPTAVEEARQKGAVEVKRMDLEFQQWKVQQDSETKIAVAEIGAKVDKIALFLEERARLSGEEQAAHDRAHEAGIAAMGHAHGQMAADAAHANALEQSEAGNQNAMALAEHAQSIAPEPEQEAA